MIIFDLGGVAFKEPEHFIFENLPEDIKSQFPADFKSPRVFLRAFDFVNLVSQTDLKMPWLMGVISGTEIANIILKNIDDAKHGNFFTSEQERLLIKHGALMMFDPELLAQWTYLYPEALESIKKYKKEGIRLLILSNWDPLSFEYIKEKYPELFACFANEDIFIPATIGYAKPDKKVYRHILETLHINNQDCFFIDDSKKNVEAAIECGIKSILHTHWNSTKSALEQRQHESLLLKKADAQEIIAAHNLLVECGNHMAANLGLYHWHPFASLEQFKEKIKHATVYCLYDNGRLVATFNLSTTARTYYRATDWRDAHAQAIYLGNLAVHPDFQGKKIGSLCVQYIEQIAKEMGASAIRFDCIERHPWLSSFYEKMGYEKKALISMPEPTGNLVCFEKIIPEKVKLCNQTNNL